MADTPPLTGALSRASRKIRSYATARGPSGLRIAFLVTNVDGMGGTTSAVVTQANALVALDEQHSVSIVSVTRTSDHLHHPPDPRVQVHHLVDVSEPETPRALLPGVGDRDVQTRLAKQDSTLVPRRWSVSHTGLTDAALREFLRETRCDVLVTTTPELLAVATQLAPDTAIVHQEHRASSTRSTVLEPLLTFGPRADVLTCLTGNELDWLAEQLGGGAPEMVVMPNALPPLERPRSPLDQKLFVSAGRLVAEKQFTHLVRAFAQVADELPQWRLRICGEGPERDILLATSRELGVADRVELPGRTEHMIDEWAAASAVVLSSAKEGFPLVLMEAMAAGVPPISYDCPSGPREIITHGEDGLLVPPNSPPALAAAMLQVAGDDTLRTRLGSTALASSRAFDADALARRWVEVFRSAVARRRAPAAPRRVLHGRRPGAVLGTPRAGSTATGLTPTEARRTTLALLAGIANEVAGNNWWVVPAHTAEEPVRLVLPSPQFRRFLDTLATADVPPWLSVAEPAIAGWTERRGTPEAMRDALLRTAAAVLRVEPWPGRGGHHGLLTRGSGVQVEFWSPDNHGGFLAPTQTRYGTVLPAGTPLTTAEVEGVPVRTVPEMLLPTVDEVTFDVDVVYTWVDGSDPQWQEARARRLAAAHPEASAKESSGEARYRSRDELLWSMRSVHLFAPWVRRIHLVTAGQTPPWLDTSHPAINLVDHRDILPADALPTFSSHAIESRLHHIPGLSEAFVYLNDDVMLGQPLGPEFFFSPSGQYAAFLATKTIGLPGLPEPPYLASARTNQALLRQAHDANPTHLVAHSPHPMSRSALAAIEEEFPQDLARTARSPFRADTDVTLTSGFAQHHGLRTGRAVPATATHAYVALGSPYLKRSLPALLRRDNDFFCIADAHTSALPEEVVTELLTSTMEKYFPVAAPWER